MPNFNYIALNGAGAEVKGAISVENAKLATTQLRGQGLFVTEITEVDDNDSGLSKKIEFDLSRYRSVSGQALVFFFRQLSFMLRSGLPVLHALELSRTQVSSGRLKDIIAKMVSDISAGLPMSDAMRKHPVEFSPLMVNLVRAGENTGDLHPIMERIALHTEKKMALKTMIINAMIYPVIVILASIGVAVFLVWKIIPKFEKFIVGRGKKLPDSTQLLIDISHFVQKYGLTILIATLVIVVAIFFFYKTKSGRFKIDGLLLKLPILGGLLRHGAMAQLNWSLSTMLRSGLTVRDGLLITSSVVTNRVISIKLESSAHLILAGQDLASSIRSPLIPDLIVQMISVGERTGTLEMVLHELGVFYENNLQNGIKRLSTLIEPVMILVIGTMVGFVYYSFFQAMFRLAGK